MPQQGVLLTGVLIGLLTGCLLGTQPSANGYLARNLAHPLQASVISFGSGFVIMVVISLIAGVFPPQLSVRWTALPWWAWFGGAIGTVMVTTSLIFVYKIGSLTWFAAVITGQVVVALILDQWGLMGNPRSPASPLRLIGAAMLVGGILLITRAKSLELQKTRPALMRPAVEAPADPPAKDR